VWRQFDDPWYNIWSNRYTAGVGWANAQRIESNNLGDAYDPQVAIDPSGNAIAVWCEWEWEIPRCNIWSNRYTAGVGWATALLIETDNSGDAFNSQVAVDPSGDMIAVWNHWDGTRDNIWSNRYVKPDTIPPALTLSSPADGSITDTSVVMVSGTTEPGSILSVNGLTVSVTANGSFSCAIDLFDGPNTIDAIAMDGWGNRAEIQITVTYNDPLPSLISDMISMEGRIASLEGSLENISDDFEDVLSRLSTLEETMNITSSDIDTISEGLATIGVDLQTYKDDLTRLRGLIDAIGSELNESVANVNGLKEALNGIGDELEMTQGGVDDLQRSLAATDTKLNSIDHELNLTSDRLTSVQSDQSIMKDDQESNEKEIDSLKDDLDAMKKLNLVLLTVLGFTLLLVFILFFLVIVTRTKVSPREIHTGLPDSIRNGT